MRLRIIIIFFLLSGPITAMEETALNMADITRYGTLSEFKSMLDTLSPEQVSAVRLPDKSNLLHCLAYPLTSDELELYNIQTGKNRRFIDFARIHAVKADILLRKCGNSLFEKNIHGDTPAYLAATSGWLPVLARIMASRPTDWPFFIDQIRRPAVKILVHDFLEMMSIRHHYPPIVDDLHTQLSLKDTTDLYEWGEKTQELLKTKAPIKKHPLGTLTFKQLSYLFEGYITYDIHQQYAEHRNHPKVKDLFNSNN